MKKTNFALLVGAVFWSSFCQADGTNLGVYLDAAIESQSWDFTSKGKDLQDLQGDWVAAKLTTTFALDRYYLQLNYSAPIRPSREYFDTALLQSDRDDGDVVLGANIIKGLNVFIGEKYGRTRLYNDYVDNSGATPELSSAEISFIENGPFAGISWAQSVSDWGTIAVSGAYAVMSGKLNFRDSGSNTEIKGDATGYSIGATWSGSLSSKVLYKLGYKRHRYDFEGTLGPVTLRNQEIMNILFAGLSFNLR